MTAAASGWASLTDQGITRLFAEYLLWLTALSEIRERVDKLNDEVRLGWNPSRDIITALDDLTARDEYFAAHDMSRARQALDIAEADAAASKPHRLARIERCKERIASLERAFNGGWRPTKGLKWPHPAVVAWCGLFSGARWSHLDVLEANIGRFEQLLPKPPKLQLGPRLLGRRRRH